MYIKVQLSLLPLMLVLGLPCAEAASGTGGVSLSGTRLVFDGGKDAASMSVTNSSAADVWLMRFWVSPYGDKSDASAEAKKNLPFAVTPPLYRLDQNSAVQLRVNKLTDDLPADRESVYYLNSLAIPPKKGEKNYQKSVQSGLQFAVNTRIKLFYRPAAISNADAVKGAPEKLTVSASGNTVVVKNPTPYFVTMTQMAINGKTVQTDKDSMVPPFGEWALPAGGAHGSFRYHTVDDRGMTTPAIEKRF